MLMTAGLTLLPHCRIHSERVFLGLTVSPSSAESFRYTMAANLDSNVLFCAVHKPMCASEILPHYRKTCNPCRQTWPAGKPNWRMRVTAAVLMHVRVWWWCVCTCVGGGGGHGETTPTKKTVNYLSLRLKLLPLDRLRPFFDVVRAEAKVVLTDHVV